MKKYVLAVLAVGFVALFYFKAFYAPGIIRTTDGYKEMENFLNGSSQVKSICGDPVTVDLVYLSNYTYWLSQDNQSKVVVTLVFSGPQDWGIAKVFAYYNGKTWKVGDFRIRIVKSGKRIWYSHSEVEKSKFFTE